jgi:PKD repeat protein
MINNYLKFIVIIVINQLLFSSKSTAQFNRCGFDQLRFIKSASSDKTKLLEKQINDLIYQKTRNTASSQILATYTVPIVVHIVHTNGPENLPDSTIQNIINQLNLRFQNAEPYFNSFGNPSSINFCLASVDPQGNATSGITRNFSNNTFLSIGTNDSSLFEIATWDPLHYLNIWIVNSIDGLSGSITDAFSSTPSDLGTNSDGIVFAYNSLRSNFLTHEIGHYFGLYHTFNTFSCNNGNCLLDGDLICDTPPDISINICQGNSCATDNSDTTGLSPFFNDVEDLPNYMDFGDCIFAFTDGQNQRMSITLNQIRNQLLISQGCGFVFGNPPNAQFNYQVSPCNDGKVQFYDTISTNYATVNWDFNNDGIYDSFQSNPIYTFEQTGTYTVKLLICGQGGVSTIEQSIFVQRAPNSIFPIQTLTGLTPNQNGTYETCNGLVNVFTAAPALSYLWSNGQTTQSISVNAELPYSIYLTITDASGLVWSNEFCSTIQVNIFEYPPVPTISSSDTVFNCQGDTISFISDISGLYTYNWFVNNNLYSQSSSPNFSLPADGNLNVSLILTTSLNCESESNEINISVNASPPEQVIYQNGLQLYTEWNELIQWSFNGNPIVGAVSQEYIVNEPGCYTVAWSYNVTPNCVTTSEQYCYTIVDVNSNVSNQKILIDFNNQSNILNIKNHSGNSQVIIFDALGKVVHKKEINSNSESFYLGDLSSGVYIIRIEHLNQFNVKKLIKL